MRRLPLLAAALPLVAAPTAHGATLTTDLPCYLQLDKAPAVTVVATGFGAKKAY